MHIALTSYMIQAACSLNDESVGDSGIAARDKLNKALQLSGKMNVMMNTHRRESFKISIPAEKKSIIDLPVQPESEHLFGDDLEDRLNVIKKKNQLKKEFARTPAAVSTKKVPSSNQTKKNTYSGNEKAPQKSQGEHQQGSKPKGKSKDEGKENHDRRKSSYKSQPYKKKSSGYKKRR